MKKPSIETSLNEKLSDEQYHTFLKVAYATAEKTSKKYAHGNELVEDYLFSAALENCTRALLKFDPAVFDIPLTAREPDKELLGHWGSMCVTLCYQGFKGYLRTKDPRLGFSGGRDARKLLRATEKQTKSEGKSPETCLTEAFLKKRISTSVRLQVYHLQDSGLTAEYLERPSPERPDTLFFEKEQKILLQKAFNAVVSERGQSILLALLAGEKSKTIAEKLKVTESRISQIIKKSTQDISSALNKDAPLLR